MATFISSILKALLDWKNEVLIICEINLVWKHIHIALTVWLVGAQAPFRYMSLPSIPLNKWLFKHGLIIEFFNNFKTEAISHWGAGRNWEMCHLCDHINPFFPCPLKLSGPCDTYFQWSTFRSIYYYLLYVYIDSKIEILCFLLKFCVFFWTTGC